MVILNEYIIVINETYPYTSNISLSEGDIELGANWVHGNQSDNSLWLYANSDEYKGEKPTYDNIKILYETASFQRSSGRKIPQETVNEAFGFLEQILGGGDEEDIGTEELENLSLQEAGDLAVSEYISLVPSATERQKEDFKAAMGINYFLQKSLKLCHLFYS